MLKPETPPPVVSGRGAFAGLPKRVAAKPAVAPSRLVVSAAPNIQPAPVKMRVHNFDPGLQINRGDGLEEIPW